MEDFTQAIQASLFVKYPGYIFAPIMLVAASLITFVWLGWRKEAQPKGMREFFEFTFAISRWKSRSALADVILYGAGKLLPKFASSLLAFAIAGVLVNALSTYTTPADAPVLGVGALLFVAASLLIALDLGDYCAHLALHRVPILWELHKVHHSATFLSPVTSFRVHPLEGLVYTVCHSITIAPVLAVTSFFYSLDFVSLLDLMFATNAFVLVLTLNHLKHSHFQISLGPMDYVLISPHMHQLHHSVRVEHWDKNLGLIFSVWDWAFGTAVREDPKEPVAYGIGRGPEADAQYVTLYGMFLRPIIGMFSLVTGRQSPERKPDIDQGVLYNIRHSDCDSQSPVALVESDKRTDSAKSHAT